MSLLRERLAAIQSVDPNRRFYIFAKRLRETDAWAGADTDFDARPLRGRICVHPPPQVEIEIECHFKGVSSSGYRQRRTEALLTIAECVAEVGAKFAVWDGLLSAGTLKGGIPGAIIENKS